MKSNSTFFFVAFGLLFLSCLLVIGFGQGWFGEANLNVRQTNNVLDDKPTNNTPVQQQAKSLSEALGVGDDELVAAGGIRRPKSDVEFYGVVKPKSGDRNPLPYAGLPEPLPKSTNEQVSKLVDELKTNPTASRKARSVYAKAEPFLVDEYLKDPDSYLSLIRPSRVYQTATSIPQEPTPPGKEKVELTNLTAKSPLFQWILRGEKVNLSAKGEPGMPITFHLNQYGFFDNQLKTISVKFNEEGIATVVYTAGPGSQGLVNILAASPVHLGQLKYSVLVR